MPFSSAFESVYIRRFEEAVRNHSPRCFELYLPRIEEALAEIPDPETRAEAMRRLVQITRYGPHYIEDVDGSSPGIAHEIAAFAEFVSRIS
jgi:hypothetical protein